MLNLTGGLFGTLIAFTMPCSMALKMMDDPLGGRALCWCVLVVGTLAGFATTVATIYGMAA